MGTAFEHRKLQTYYAYIWESIKWAKEQGCLWYSFRGVGTTPSQEKFKAKFKPRVVSLVGYYDLPFHRPLYHVICRSEFDLLPRLWKNLMKLRQGYNALRSQIVTIPELTSSRNET